MIISKNILKKCIILACNCIHTLNNHDISDLSDVGTFASILRLGFNCFGVAGCGFHRSTALKIETIRDIMPAHILKYLVKS